MENINQPQDWEKEFNEKFSPRIVPTFDMIVEWQKSRDESIKDFFRSKFTEYQEKVIITDKERLDKDEMYCYWYKCPNCLDNNIPESQKYCGNCGKKIEWMKSSIE
jgi:hypothetical protein